MRADLLDGSRAILIATADYRDENFPPVPAAANSLTAMRQILTDPDLCGWPPASITVFQDPTDAPQLVKKLRKLAADTERVLLVYFVGHGVMQARGRLCLVLTDTDAEHPDITGVDYAHVHEALNGSSAPTKIVILDCCYSGRAIETLSAATTNAIADETAIEGAHTITASDRAAHVPPLAQQADNPTSFTGELVDLVRTGIPGGPEHLTLDLLYPHLRRRLRRRGLPLPNQRIIGQADRFPFTRNAALTSPRTTSAGPGRTTRHEVPEDLVPSAEDPPDRTASAEPGPPPTALPVTTQDPPTAEPAALPPAGPPRHPSAPAARRPVSRRKVLLWGGLGVMAAGVPTALALTRGPQWTVVATVTARKRTSMALLGPDFTILATEGVDEARWWDPATGEAQLWDVTTGKPRAALTGHKGVSAMAFSPDGTILATGNYGPQVLGQGPGGVVRLWDVSTGKLTAPLTGHAGSIRLLAFSPDGRTLASHGDDPWTVFPSPGKDIRKVRLWNVRTGELTATLTGRTPVHQLAFSPDGKTLATLISSDTPTAERSTVHLWDVESRKVAATLTGRYPVDTMAFSSDGTMLATSHNEDTVVRVWNTATDKLTATLTGHDGGVTAMAFRPKSKIVAVSNWGPIVAGQHLVGALRMWDVTTGKLTATLTGHYGDVTDMVFSPDGRTLAANNSNRDNPLVWLWDVTTGEHTATLTGHDGHVTALAFSPDGGTLATKDSSPPRVRLWRLQPA